MILVGEGESPLSQGSVWNPESNTHNAGSDIDRLKAYTQMVLYWDIAGRACANCMHFSPQRENEVSIVLGSLWWHIVSLAV